MITSWLFGLLTVLTYMMAPLYVATAVLLVVAWRRPKVAVRLRRIAAWLALSGGMLTLVSGLTVVLAPEFTTGGFNVVGLVILTSLFPLITMVGAGAMLFGKRWGAGMLYAGVGLWLFFNIAGVLANMTDYFG